MSIKPSKHDPTRDAQLEAYLIAFDNFATDTREVAKKLGCTLPEANEILKSMEGSLLCRELIHNGTMARSARSRQEAPGICYTWQCCETYDSITRDEAIERFNKVFPA